jgi:putative zinc finger protein
MSLHETSLCETHQIALSSLLDGALPPGEVAETVDHLLDCPTCRAFYRDARALQAALARSGATASPASSGMSAARVIPISAPEGLASDEVWRRIEAESARRARRARRPAAWALRVAAGLLLAVAAAWGVSQQMGRGAMPREVVLGGESGRMSQARFVEIATEVLEADPSYRREMLRVMREADEVAGSEAPVDEGPASEHERTGAEEGAGRRLAS